VTCTSIHLHSGGLPVRMKTEATKWSCWIDVKVGDDWALTIFVDPAQAERASLAVAAFNKAMGADDDDA
jgi:hypothetical protein